MKAKNETSTKMGTLTVVDSTFNPPDVTVYANPISFKTDIVIPGAIVRGDKVRPNPWNYTLETIDRGAGSYTRQVGKAEYNYNGPVNMGSTAVQIEDLSQEIDLCYNEALSNFNEKVRGTLDLAVDLAQGAQTAGMLNKAKAVIELTRKFRRRAASPWKWREITTETGSLWLEWQYGWMPLVSSIHGLLEQMGGDGQGWVKPIRTGNSRSIELPNTVDKISFGLNHKYQVTGKTDIRTSICGRVQLAGISPATVTSLNPASLAWELLPYSFVVDWFYSVGDYIRNVETACLYAPNWMYGHATTSIKTEATLSTRDTQGIYKTFDFTVAYRYVDVHRRVLDEYPTPRPPHLQIDLGSSQMLNAAALLSQLLK